MTVKKLDSIFSTKATHERQMYVSPSVKYSSMLTKNILLIIPVTILQFYLSCRLSISKLVKCI